MFKEKLPFIESYPNSRRNYTLVNAIKIFFIGLVILGVAFVSLFVGVAVSIPRLTLISLIYINFTFGLYEALNFLYFKEQKNILKLSLTILLFVANIVASILVYIYAQILIAIFYFVLYLSFICVSSHIAK